jgi:hypothetical protein
LWKDRLARGDWDRDRDRVSFAFLRGKGVWLLFWKEEGIKRDVLFGMRDGWGFGGIVGRCGRGEVGMVHDGSWRGVNGFLDAGFEGLLL